MAGKDSSSSGPADAGPSSGGGGGGGGGGNGGGEKPDPEKAIRFKEEGNRCFGRGEWSQAEGWYVRA